jgi:hypothetical protein
MTQEGRGALYALMDLGMKPWFCPLGVLWGFLSEDEALFFDVEL